MPPHDATPLLLVERHPATGRALAAALDARGYAVAWADTGEKAFNLLEARRFDALVTVLQLRRTDAFRILQVARARTPDVCAVVLVPPGQEALGEQAVARGALAYLPAPADVERLQEALRQGLAYQALARAHQQLLRRVDARYGLAGLVGQSPAMAAVYQQVREWAGIMAPVLLTGEPGVGLDTLALALHHAGPRYDRAFVTFAPAGLPPTAQAAALMGEAGQPGRIDHAQGGTLYIDRIEALGPAAQGGVAQALSAGGLRLIASATQDLDGLARVGAFDRELTRLLTANRIAVPPLRERREDIGTLAAHFLAEAGRPDATLHPAAADALHRYAWPGNVVELREAIVAAARQAGGRAQVEVADLPEAVRVRGDAEAVRVPVGTPLREAERMLIEATLRATGYKKEAAAKTLGIGLRTLYRKLEAYGLHTPADGSGTEP